MAKKSTKQPEHGIVYVLINEAMPKYVKIGRTKNLEERIRSLNRTNIPLPFECVYASTVKNAEFVEKQLLDVFLDQRVQLRREFFKVSPDRVVSALKLVEIENVTPQKDYVETPKDQRALEQARRIRRANFNFVMADIPVDAELSYINDEKVKAKVVDNKQIEVKGEVTSLSAAAQKLLGYDYQVRGTTYWMYEGETLDERRDRLEAEE